MSLWIKRLFCGIGWHWPATEFEMNSVLDRSFIRVLAHTVCVHCSVLMDIKVTYIPEQEMLENGT